MTNIDIESIDFDALLSDLTVRITEQHEVSRTQVKFNGATLLKQGGEILTVAGAPGKGKSTLAGVIAASALGTSQFGLEFVNATKKVLYIDTERTRGEVHKAMKEISDRLNNPADIERLIMIFSRPLRSNPARLREVIEAALTKGEFSTVIIDGILDFASLNVEADVRELIGWLDRLALNNNCAVVVTIHPNKGNDILAGHLGHYLWRYSRAVLFIRRSGKYTTISTEGENAKTSHADCNAIPKTLLQWNDEREMLEEVRPQKSDLELMVGITRALQEKLSNFESERALMKEFTWTQKLARSMRALLVEKGMIERSPGDKRRVWYQARSVSMRQ